LGEHVYKDGQPPPPEDLFVHQLLTVSHSLLISRTANRFLNFPVIKMHISTTALTAIMATLVASQTLKIPTRIGSIVSLSAPSPISGLKDLGNQEFDRGRACNSDDDGGSDGAVFILENGATLANVIIGANQLEGIHCKGACTLRNVWFRDVCEGRFPSMLLQFDIY
jgi:hypothetical protein